MIEAVNSSVANAQILRGSAEQLSASSVAVKAAPVAVSEVSAPPKAPYISPYISVDTKSNKAVLQIRNSDTGEVEQQFPTKSRLAQLSQLQAKYENTQKVRISDDAPKNIEVEASESSIITVQDVTSSAPSNSSLPTPEVAAAALSAGAQSGQASLSAGVSVFA